MIKEIKNKLRYYRNYTEVNNTRDGMGLKINSIQGNTQQDSTTGKNLYKGNSITASNAGAISDIEISLANGKTYTVSLNKSVATQADMYLKDADHNDITKLSFKNNGKNTLTFKPSEDVHNIGWYIAGAMSITDIQIEEGSTATAYEPYTGGIPSPNPLYPQPINSAVVSEVKVSGKNMLDCSGLIEQTSNGVKFTPVYDANGKLLYVNANGTSNANSYYVVSQASQLSQGEYILSGCPVGGSSSKYALYIDRVTNDFGDGRGFTVSASASYKVVISVASGQTANNLKFYPMIRKADISDASYEPYQGNTITLSSPIELNKIGGVADEVAEGKVTRRFVQEVITQALNMDSTNLLASLKLSHSPKPIRQGTIVGNFLCDKFAPNTLEMLRFADSGIAGYGVNIYIRVSSIEQTVEAYNAWLSENPITVLYELAEPVVTDLPTEDKVALNSLNTVDGTSFISIESVVQPIMEMEYGVMRYREWKSGDYFNAEDYNRITGNVSYLKAYLDGLFANMENISDKEEKTYLSLIYAREINAIENELDSINRESYGLEIGTKQIYRANGKTPIYSEYDRIESALARIMEKALLHKNNLPRLAFRLGGQKGLRL